MSKILLKLMTVLLIAGPVTPILSQQLSLQSIFLSGQFYQETGDQFKFRNTSASYTQLLNEKNGFQSIASYSIASGKKERTLLNTDALKEYFFIDHYDFSEDDRMLLLGTERESIYRYSRQSYYYIYDTEKATIYPLSLTSKVMYPHFSPDNKKVGFVKGNDLYYSTLSTGEEIRITHDGKVNEIINGRADWVHEEEFEMTRTYEWSADGSGVLLLSMDERAVPEFTYINYDGSYPYTSSFKYPRAGSPNAITTLKYYDVIRDSLYSLSLPFEYEYIPKIIRAGDGFAVLTLNRHQNQLRVLLFDPESRTFEQIYEEEDPRYVELPLIFSALSAEQLVISSEREGFNHLYYIDRIGFSPITAGEFEVTAYYGRDAAGGHFFQSSQEGAEERHIYKVLEPLSEPVRLTADRGTHNAVFSGDMTHFVDRYSADGKATAITVRDQNGRLVRTIEDNAGLQKLLDGFWQHKEFSTVTLSDSVAIPTWVIKPPGFDPGKQYPVLLFAYGGPGRQRVTNNYNSTLDLWFQLLAQEGYIIVCADNRGTPGLGAAFKKVNYLTLGKYGVEDQLNLIKKLGELPYVDASRIGMYGWSYGAYLSLLCLFKGDGLLKSALSIAPVTHWKFYDTIYTERYMRTPQENPEGYDDWAPLNNVSEWRKGDLLLAHGTADDNVHFQNTAELLKEMNSRGKEYTFFCYPDGDHGMGTYANYYHLMQQMTHFILEKL